MYRIRGADQKEYGPVNATVIRQWITERRATPQTLLQQDGGAWQPLTQFPEFADALAVATARPAPFVVEVAPPLPPRPPASRRAVLSLVLGVVSVGCLGLLTGIFAIIIGHLEYRRTRNGLAVAGFVLGYMSIITTVVLTSILVPAFTNARSRALRVVCLNNMERIGLAAQSWAQAHEQILPPNFASLSNHLDSAHVLICPSDRLKVVANNWSILAGTNISYEFVAAGEKVAKSERKIVFRCPLHDHVGYNDGSAARVPNTY